MDYLLSFGPYVIVGCVGIGYVLRVELPIQRRLCLIFLRDVGSPDIHECFRELTGSQWTLGFGTSQSYSGPFLPRKILFLFSSIILNKL